MSIFWKKIEFFEILFFEYRQFTSKVKQRPKLIFSMTTRQWYARLLEHCSCRDLFSGLESFLGQLLIVIGGSLVVANVASTDVEKGTRAYAKLAPKLNSRTGLERSGAKAGSEGGKIWLPTSPDSGRPAWSVQGQLYRPRPLRPRHQMRLPASPSLPLLNSLSHSLFHRPNSKWDKFLRQNEWNIHRLWINLGANDGQNTFSYLECGTIKY